MTTLYKFKAYYTDAGVGAVQDPAPTCTVINMADDSKLADAQATTASTNMPGLYSYEYSGNDGLDCVAWFKTTDTGCDVKQLASYVSEKITTNLNADVAGVETKIDTIDTNVDSILADTGTDGVKIASGELSTVATASSITALDGKIDTIDNFLDTEIADILADTNELQAELADGGRTDLLIDAIKAKSDLIPATPAEAGEYTAAIAAIPTTPLLAANHVAPDNATITTIAGNVDDLETRLTAERAGYLDNLNTGVALTAAGIDAILDEAVVDSYTLRQLLKVMAAALAGKATGGGTTEVKFRGVDDASDVIVATVDANGNRSAVTLTV